MNPDLSPLLKPIFKREFLINKAENALEQGKLEEAREAFEKVYNICLEIGDESLAIEYRNKTEKLKSILK